MVTETRKQSEPSRWHLTFGREMRDAADSTELTASFR